MKSKYYLILFVPLVFHATLVFSQKKKSLWLHAIGGINSSWIANQNAYGNPEFEYATTFKLSAGGGITYYITDEKNHTGSRCGFL